MLHIKIVSVGKIKEKYLLEGIREYEKRLRAYVRLEFAETPDSAIPSQAGSKVCEQIRCHESDVIRARLKDSDYVVLLDRLGENVSSERLAALLDDRALHGSAQIVFVIGGSLGVDEDLRRRANWTWSFSALTFPHQLMRLMLMEQIYRACKIRAHEVYHK
ncbi:MAG: 23S rRNA (pseudouridine(1915)-N(3))-methyltransferase RlmH [Peptococcaceae bacterium]|nr:23S rRNA (pseudouridine(1915)-N(3))-methyltransferase RlmH [Peptococcaceae bacterium]